MIGGRVPRHHAAGERYLPAACHCSLVLFRHPGQARSARNFTRRSSHRTTSSTRSSGPTACTLAIAKPPCKLPRLLPVYTRTHAHTHTHHTHTHHTHTQTLPRRHVRVRHFSFNNKRLYDDHLFVLISPRGSSFSPPLISPPPLQREFEKAQGEFEARRRSGD
jgi:hypothetical protein